MLSLFFSTTRNKDESSFFCFRSFKEYVRGFFLCRGHDGRWVRVLEPMVGFPEKLVCGLAASRDGEERREEERMAVSVVSSKNRYKKGGGDVGRC